MEGGFLECEFLFLIGQNNTPSNSHFCQKGIGLCYTAHGIPCASETKIQRTYEGDHQVYCVHCGAENPTDATFCQKCGKRLPTPDQDELTVPSIHSALSTAKETSSLYSSIGFPGASRYRCSGSVCLSESLDARQNHYDLLCCSRTRRLPDRLRSTLNGDQGQLN